MNTTLLSYCAGIIVVITVQAVVVIRQQYQRKLTGLPPPPPGVLFPNITRAVADDGIPECTKFLFNYGFYKFGVEVRIQLGFRTMLIAQIFGEYILMELHSYFVVDI